MSNRATALSWLAGVLLVLGLVVQMGCGGGAAPKTDDPSKVEQERKEHLDMSHKERSG